jgi:hypothetical protein
MNANVFYTDRGGVVSSAPSGDADSFASYSSSTISYWYIALFRKGESASASRRGQHWGMITEPSPALCRDQLQRSQRFERQYERWAQLPEGCTIDTYFNPLGPVAKMKQPLSLSKESVHSAAQRLLKGWNEIKHARDDTE